MKKGFTLIELLIVIAILGVFVALVISQFNINSRELDCSDYERYPVEDLPVGCYGYYGIEKGVE